MKHVTKNKGFTLIETVVTIVIFSFLVLSMTGIAISVVRGQRKAFALQDTQETGRHILELVSREIRMSVLGADMATGGPFNFLEIRNAYEDDVTYKFEENKLKRCVGAVPCANWQNLNEDDMQITGGFYVRKSSAPDPSRSSVTLVLKIELNKGKIEERAEIYLQNTLSLRSYEVL